MVGEPPCAGPPAPPQGAGRPPPSSPSAVPLSHSVSSAPDAVIDRDGREKKRRLRGLRDAHPKVLHELLLVYFWLFSLIFTRSLIEIESPTAR